VTDPPPTTAPTPHPPHPATDPPPTTAPTPHPPPTTGPTPHPPPTTGPTPHPAPTTGPTPHPATGPPPTARPAQGPAGGVTADRQTTADLTTARRLRLLPGPGPGRRRPNVDEVTAAADRTIPDVTGPDLLVLFSGINPSLYSAATGHHFARPGNRFWPALHGAGFTDRLLHPSEQHLLPPMGLGITNVVSRATARADELSLEEFAEGGAQLADRVSRLRPRYLAVLGVTAYRAAFKRPKAKIGPQAETISGVPVWVLPNPSGLNAHFQLPALISEFAALRAAARP
jgi:TDG/mug DNA glycosylase family protein